MEKKLDTLPLRKQMHVLKRLMKTLKPHKLTLVIGFFFAMVAVFFDLMAPLIQRNLIDNYVLSENFDMPKIFLLIGLFVLVSFAYTFFNYMSTFTFHKIGNRITEGLRNDLFEKLQDMGMRYFDQTPVGSIVSRLSNDTETIQDMFVNVLSVIMINIMLILGILVVMFRLNVKLAFISMMFIPIAIFFMLLYQKISTKYYQKSREKNSQINTRLSESISGMKIIQEFNQQKRMIKEFSDLNDEYYEASLMNQKINGLLLSPIIHVLTSLALSLIMYLSGVSYLNGELISVGSIMAFVELIYRLFDPMFQIMDRLSIYQEAIVSSDRIFTIMDHTEVTPRQNEDANESIKEGKIEFRNVSFSYDGVHKVLNNISFVVQPGETLAFVGHTGSGKSSIINVMMRFYEFFEGDILIDDCSIRDYPLENLRQNMSLVLQDPFIYFGSIKDNVRLLDESISDEAIVKACEFVKADRFINALDQKYDHEVIEQGAAFSTGQKQLLAFARAIVTDPKILILDEATANIDSETEGLIQEGLEKIRRGRTTLMIAHRLSTIKDANQIIVLNEGHIVEAGNHESLMAQKGIYHDMIELQKNTM